MISSIMVLMSGCIVLFGAMLVAAAKSGPQETLGGVIVSFGILVAMGAAALWGIGL